MATAIVMMEQNVSAADIDQNNVRCPNCQSTTFVLTGYSQVTRTESWENGQLTYKESDKDSYCVQVETIECLSCMVRSRIQPAEYIELQGTVQRLRKQIIDLGEPDPLMVGKPN